MSIFYMKILEKIPMEKLVKFKKCAKLICRGDRNENIKKI